MFTDNSSRDLNFKIKLLISFVFTKETIHNTFYLWNKTITDILVNAKKKWKFLLKFKNSV